MSRDTHAGPSLRLLWLCVLAPAFSWAAALGLLLPMAEEACHGTRSWLAVTGVLFVILAAAPGFVAWRHHRHSDAQQGDGDYVRFLLELGIGSAILFTLVNLLFTVPIFFMSACPG